MLAGVRGRCPLCGEGLLFCGFLKVCEHRASCGADLSRADSGDGPVVFILLIVGAIGCIGLLFTEVVLHPSVWLELLIWPPLTGAATLGALRPLKGVMIALQFHNRASEARRDEH
jgi:uncharacterized protein (DUF983 family)